MDEFKELYENLSPNKLSIENVTQLETKVELLEQEIKQLEAALNQSELDKRNLNINYERDKKNLLKNHESLLANVSALFKTAKKEIERKNNTIKELRQQLDDFIFRRHQKRWPPPNEVVQSQNEDDAICAKPVTDDRPVSSVIRPIAKNDVFTDREKSSTGDKSLLPARIGARPHENTENDIRVDSSRVQCRVSARPHGNAENDKRVESSQVQWRVSARPHENAENDKRVDSSQVQCRVSTRPFENAENDKRVDSSRGLYRVSTRPQENAENDKRVDSSRVQCRVSATPQENPENDKRVDSSRVQCRVSARPHENAENVKRVDSSRVQCVENTSLECRQKDYYERKYPHSTARDGVQDDHYDSKNSPDSCPYRRSDKKIRETDDREYRICRKAKERHRYSPYEHRKEDHERSRYKHRRQERDHNDEEYLKRRAKRSPYDRDRHEFGDGYRTADSRLEVEYGSRKSNEDRRSDHSGRSASDDRRRETESSSRKSFEDRRREDPAFQNLMERRRRPSPDNLEVVSRKPPENRRRTEGPAQLECGVKKPINDRQREDLPNGEFNVRKSIAEQSAEHLATGLVFKGRKSSEGRQKNNLTDSEFSARKSIGDQKSIEEGRKDNPAHLEMVAKKPPCDRKDPVHPKLAAKKLINDRKRDFAVAKLGGQKSIVDRKRANPLDPKCVDKKPNESRQTEDEANSSQNVVANQVLPGTHAENGYPVDGPMKAVDILAQYGVYATPYKLLNGDISSFGRFKLVSPIADTPDHLKALFNNSKVKVSPIPMINERRVLDGFNSPAKKSVTPAEAAKKDSTAVANKNSDEEPSKKVLVDDSMSSPSPSKLLLNTVTTSPFKNCCIVKVKAEVVNNSPAETAPKEPVSGTDTTNAEHGVFTRKRRAPVIRHIKKAES